VYLVLLFDVCRSDGRKRCGAQRGDATQAAAGRKQRVRHAGAREEQQDRRSDPTVPEMQGKGAGVHVQRPAEHWRHGKGAAAGKVCASHLPRSVPAAGSGQITTVR